MAIVFVSALYATGASATANSASLSRFFLLHSLSLLMRHLSRSVVRKTRICRQSGVSDSRNMSLTFTKKSAYE